MAQTPKEIITSLLSGIVSNPSALWEVLTTEWLGAKAWTQVDVMLDLASARLATRSGARTDFSVEFPLSAEGMEKVAAASPEEREFWCNALLLERGANPWTFLSSQGGPVSPVHSAVQRWAARGWISLVRQAWDHPGRLRAGQSEEDFWNSRAFQDLMVPAIATNQMELVKFYVGKGCPLNHFVPGRQTSTLRHAATPAMARFLLESGADPDLDDEGGFNPIERWATDHKESLLDGSHATITKVSPLVEAVWQHCARFSRLDRPAFRSYPVVLTLLREFKRLPARAPLAPYGWGRGPSPTIHLPASTPLGMLGVLAGTGPLLPLHAWRDVTTATRGVADQLPPEELLQCWMALAGLYADRTAKGALVSPVEQMRHMVADMIVHPESLDETDIETDWSEAVERWNGGMRMRGMRPSPLILARDRVAEQWLKFLEIEPRAADMDPVAETVLFKGLLQNSPAFRSSVLQVLSSPAAAGKWWTARAGAVPSYVFTFSPSEQQTVLAAWGTSGAPIRMNEEVRYRLPRNLSPAVRSWVDQAILDQELAQAVARPRPRM